MTGPIPGNSRLIALAVALVVLLVSGSVGVTLGIRDFRSSAARADARPDTTQSTVPSAPRATLVVSELATVTRTAAPNPATPRLPVSDRNRTGAGVAPVESAGPESCRNGASALPGRCGSYQCWNDSVVTTGKCPNLTGVAGLTWVFGVRAGTPRQTCRVVPRGPDFAPTELERILCSWPDLPAVVLTLSRWRSAADARTALTAKYGAPTDWVAADQGMQVAQGRQWNTAPVGSNQKINAEAYDRQPYSLQAVLSDADGAGKAQWETYYDRERLVVASLLDTVVASTR